MNFWKVKKKEAVERLEVLQSQLRKGKEQTKSLKRSHSSFGEARKAVKWLKEFKKI